MVFFVMTMGCISCRSPSPSGTGDTAKGASPAPLAIEGAASSLSNPETRVPGPDGGSDLASKDLAPDLPYDRDADLRERAAQARTALGSRAATRTVGGVLLLVASRPSIAFDRASALADRAWTALLHERFARAPERAVTALLFEDQRTFESGCAVARAASLDTLLGVYALEARTLCVNIGPGASSLVHEMVHPMLQADFPRAPAWLDEGIASLFENPVLPAPGEIHGATNWRLPRLKRAIAIGRAPALDALVAMPDATFRGPDRDLNYAAARFVAQWLDARGQLWPFYQAWRDGYETDPTGEHAFESAVAMSPAQANRAWLAWVSAL